MSYSDNSREVEAWWAQAAPTRNHKLTIQNAVEYAAYLHEKHGYYIFNDPKAVLVVMQWLKEVLAAGLPLNDATIAKALDGAGYEIINFLQSLTGETRPPVKKGEGPRRAHPGGWSDITRHLAGAFEHMVNEGAFTGHPYSG